jgi:predicted DNA binding CopG/RHH family protein
MRKEYDFSKMKKRDKNTFDPDPKVMISLRMDPHDIALLRDEADRLGIPYQTLIGSIIHRFVTGELIDKKEAKKIAG